MQIELPTTEIEVYCKFINIEPEVLKLIEVGDKETDRNNETLGEIIWIGESIQYQHKFDIGGGQLLIREDPALKELPARLKLKTRIKGNFISAIWPLIKSARRRFLASAT